MTVWVYVEFDIYKIIALFFKGTAL